MADNPTLEMEQPTPVKRKGVKRRAFLIGGVAIVGAGLFGISIAGILEAQSLFEVHSFVVVLVFIIFMGILSAVRMVLQVLCSNT